MRIFLTGATGYIGGRLAPRLLERGHAVRCLVRSERKLRGRPWASDERVETVKADAADARAMADAMRGCDAGYYLIHSMESAGGSYAKRDQALARAFAMGAAEVGLRRIIYLGGLGATGDDLSGHLSSRREVETVLGETGIPLTTLRAAMIIGSGSASFEILRYLTERLPVMITPRWVGTEVQPIGVRDVLRYLCDALEKPETRGRTIDIGGADTMTYRDLIHHMGEALQLRRRLIVPVPVLTPRLSALWLYLITPVPFAIARPLTEGLRNRVVCRDDAAQQLMPGPLMTARQAIDAAVGQLHRSGVETAWSDAGVIPGDPQWAGGAEFIDQRSVPINAGAAAVFAAVVKIGGGQGYYAADFLWRLRGAMDRMWGGPGLRRGRRDPRRLGYGDALDFWRVTEIDPPRRLLLEAEMKLPGRATLGFDIEPGENGQPTRLTQTARFTPRGLAGVLYWYAVKPLHSFVFRGMMRGIAREAQRSATTAT